MAKQVRELWRLVRSGGQFRRLRGQPVGQPLQALESNVLRELLPPPVRRDGGERDGAPMSKMRQSRFFGGEILTTP